MAEIYDTLVLSSVQSKNLRFTKSRITTSESKNSHIDESPCNRISIYGASMQSKKRDGICDDPFQIANPAKG